MPELPDIETYLDALRLRVVGTALEKTRLRSPFLLRSTTPPLGEVEGSRVVRVARMGKRIVFHLQDDYALVLHLMRSGRLHWKKKGAGLPGRRGLCAFDFEPGSLLVTEAGSQKRASLFVTRGQESLEALDPGGLDLLQANAATFTVVLRRQNHTLKRALTDARIVSGIGGAYADEILHAARLSPIQLTNRTSDEDFGRLFAACREVLLLWTDRLRAKAGDAWPTVTAFRPEMAAHGKYGHPCPVCSTLIQRIVYANTQTNYCPTCQTGGRIFADRRLSRLLGKDWPRTLTELEALGVPKRRDVQ